MPRLPTHQPVLLAEVLTGLNLRPDGTYLDATFGRGGHTHAILDRLDANGRVLAFDQDPDAVHAAQTLCVHDTRFTIVHNSFSKLIEVVQVYAGLGQIHGILLDLGVSSPQLDTPTRGFSFLHDGPLDMRMNPQTGYSVGEWLAHATVSEIIQVLKDYGEERYARRIAQAIVQARDQDVLHTTQQLAAVIAKAHPAWEVGKHPATRAFQALRIFINNELEQLQQVLPQTLEILAPGGRLVVISFHSLEDRMVKRFIRDQSRGDDFPIDLPITAAQLRPRLRAIGKAQFPTAEEIADNPRARSAVLRVAEKL